MTTALTLCPSPWPIGHWNMPIPLSGWNATFSLPIPLSRFQSHCLPSNLTISSLYLPSHCYSSCIYPFNIATKNTTRRQHNTLWSSLQIVSESHHSSFVKDWAHCSYPSFHICIKWTHSFDLVCCILTQWKAHNLRIGDKTIWIWDAARGWQNVEKRPRLFFFFQCSAWPPSHPYLPNIVCISHTHVFFFFEFRKFMCNK